ncbi:hypothetical protein NLG97_g2809 [Lecanicillium saksenae]|uniref:Uncharacterized protein n=1 Tax=Lecanicillium saksenae TaxID=468837 RepID=A0ACC1R1A2_9HYPO|nr:hypothetical protein NLG97_g2809 [Lecanicillium saksenae]
MPLKSPITALAPETHLQIIQSLAFLDKVNLSATCKLFRKLLVPDIFKKLLFGNWDDGPASVLAVAKAHGQVTEAIALTLTAGAGEETEVPALLTDAAAVLSGHWTPNVLTIVLTFDFEFEDLGEGEWSDERDWLETPENDDDVELAEKKYLWRAVVNETWLAVSKNTTVKELIIDGFFPVLASAYRRPEFTRFLGQIEHAVFNLASDEGMPDTWPYHHGFQRIFPEVSTIFLSRLKSLVSLHLDGNHSMLGLSTYAHTPLPLRGLSLPSLRRLTLRSCFIDDELVWFLRQHRATLASLNVQDCFCVSVPWARDSVGTWAMFFDQFVEMRPVLTEIVAGYNADRVSRQRWLPKARDSETRERMCDALRANPGMKHFCYADFNTETGRTRMDAEANETAFRDGRDWAAYQRLVDLVEDNAVNGADIYQAPVEYNEVRNYTHGENCTCDHSKDGVWLRELGELTTTSDEEATTSDEED